MSFDRSNLLTIGSATLVPTQNDAILESKQAKRESQESMILSDFQRHALSHIDNLQ